MLLVVTATSREANGLAHHLRDAAPGHANGVEVTDARVAGVPVRLATTGIGRAATAFALARLLLDEVPAAVVQVGVGGTFDTARLAAPDVALATTDTYADLGVRTDDDWVGAGELGFPLVERDGERWFATFPFAEAPTRAAADALDAPTGPFVTVETVTGTAASADELRARHRPLVESMEGAAAAHAGVLFNVPVVQLRAASNVVGPRDRGTWRLHEAIDRAGHALAHCLPAIRGAV